MFVLCGGVCGEGDVCINHMNCVRGRPVVPPLILCCIKISRKGFWFIMIRIIRPLTIFYIHGIFLSCSSAFFNIGHICTTSSICTIVVICLNVPGVVRICFKYF